MTSRHAHPTTRDRPRAPRGAVVPALASAIAVICASTALSGVLSGVWVPFVVIAVLVVTAVGVVARVARAPRVAVVACQLIALLLLTVGLFTDTGVLGVLPGPAALHDLGGVLQAAMHAVRSGIAPLVAHTPLRCLLVVTIGPVAVLVDALSTAIRAPAVAGLPLLAVYAVPASLDDYALPWWSFVVGGAGYALLLAATHMHQAYGARPLDRAGGLPRRSQALPGLRGAGPSAIAVGGIGLVVALLIGSQATFVGTSGRLPGGGSGGVLGNSGQLGIAPFSSVQGMLDDEQHAVNLFKVIGLDGTSPYLRALTLNRFVPGRGWVLGQPLTDGVPDTKPFPAEPGGRRGGPTTNIEIIPQNWSDLWLPVFGVPRQLFHGGDGWRYDPDTGIVYTPPPPRRPQPYIERAMMAKPTQSQLRAAPTDYAGLDPSYLRVPKVDNDIVNLAKRITASARSPFDKAQAVYDYFTDPVNGFTYSLRTAPATSSSALHTFLFDGKKGFCEQYATAMAVLLREVGVPSRVAIGFTAGTEESGYRQITSLDAHAWVEVYFPHYGWLPFDPTPLADGRTHIPSYLLATTGDGTADQASQPESGSTPQRQQATPQHQATPGLGSGAAPVAAPTPARSATGWLGITLWTLIGLTLLTGLAAFAVHRRRWRRGHTRWLPGWSGAAVPVATICCGLTVLTAAAWASWWLPAVLVLLAVAATPATMRHWQRRRRLRAAAGPGTDAARAAWQEVLAESADRGGSTDARDTVRVTAAKIGRRHQFDARGQQDLQRLVAAVEHAWYGGDSARSTAATKTDTAELSSILAEIRAAFARSAPLSLRARLLPRSVLRGPGGRGDTDH